MKEYLAVKADVGSFGDKPGAPSVDTAGTHQIRLEPSPRSETKDLSSDWCTFTTTVGPLGYSTGVLMNEPSVRCRVNTISRATASTISRHSCHPSSGDCR